MDSPVPISVSDIILSGCWFIQFGSASPKSAKSADKGPWIRDLKSISSSWVSTASSSTSFLEGISELIPTLPVVSAPMPKPFVDANIVIAAVDAIAKLTKSSPLRLASSNSCVTTSLILPTTSSRSGGISLDSVHRALSLAATTVVSSAGCDCLACDASVGLWSEG